MKKNNKKIPTFSIATPTLKEQFKSDTPTDPVTFPAELGEKHPFDFKALEELYKKFGFVTGVIDKYVDFIVGPGFYVKSPSPRAKEIIDQFMHDVNFDTLLRSWVKQGLIKGSSPLELGGNKNDTIKGLKVLNADYIYVKRNKKGEILGYNQYTGNKTKAFDKKRIIPFENYQIAFLTFNQIGDSPYGTGITYPALNTINNLLGSEKDMHMLIKRKANSPIHIKLGGDNPELMPTDEQISLFAGKLEYLTNKQEWVTGPAVDMKVIDFGMLAEKFATVLDYDLDQLFFTFQVPEVLMGRGSIPEGLAQVQMDAFMRRVQSFQAEIEKIIETQIFNRVLLSNGLQDDVEFEWGQPSDTEINNRITKITELLKIPGLVHDVYIALQEELMKLLNLDVDVESSAEEREEEETELEQPEVPGTKRQETIIGELIWE